MSWVYVPGLAASSSESALPCQRLAASATWRGKLLPPPRWSVIWKRERWIRRLSGLTLPPSTADRGVAAFIASLPAIPASPTASPESGSARRMIDSSPIRSSAWSMRFGLSVSSARTCRGMRTDSSACSSRHWKGWATALNADYSARPRPAIPTAESGSSFWPTCRTSRGGYTRDNGDPAKERATLEGLAQAWPTATVAARRINRSASPGAADRPTLDVVAEHWATPRTISGGANSKRKERGAGGPDLQEQVQAWATPRASDSEKGSPNMRGSKGDVPLPGQAANWPTPAQRDYKGVNSVAHVTLNSTGSMHLDQLPNFVEHVFLPSQSSFPAQATRDGPSCCNPALSLYLRIRHTTDSKLRSEMRALLRMAVRSPEPGRKWRRGWTRTRSAPFVRPSFRRRLNPTFVEALMRWPTGWSASDCSATALTPWLRHMRGFVWTLGTASERPANAPPSQMTLL